MKMYEEQTVGHKYGAKVRTEDVIASEEITFDELLLSDSTLSGLKKSGFRRPSPIQLKAIPLGRCGLDMVVQAKSGTGKTCVFSVVALESINTSSSSLQALILAPTREIAMQIHGVITSIGKDTVGLNCQVFIGGTPVSLDRGKAKNCHIAVGSPGRIKQLVELDVLSVSSVRLFVLDEADKLVEQGSFQQQINWIYSALPHNKQMIALSATYPEALADFLKQYMFQPHFVRLNSSDPSLLGIRQYYHVIGDCALPHILFEKKAECIVDLLSSASFQQALVFSNYHSRAESLCEALNSAGWLSTYISGSMEQSRRTEAIARLKEFKCRVLISTDLTARGIDAYYVDMVINMDVPGDWETYMHRIGRAGRFGSRGTAITIVGSRQEESQLEELTKKCNASLSNLINIRDISQDQPAPPSVNNGRTDKPPIRDVTLHSTKKEKVDITRSSNVKPKAMGDQAKLNSRPAKSSETNGRGFKSRDNIKQKAEPSRSNPSAFQSRGDALRSSESDSEAASDDRGGGARASADIDLPRIPSVWDLERRSDCIRENTHYLTMSYQQLEEDYEHFAKHGTFAPPPENVGDLPLDGAITARSNEAEQIVSELSAVRLDSPERKSRDDDADHEKARESSIEVKKVVASGPDAAVVGDAARVNPTDMKHSRHTPPEAGDIVKPFAPPLVSSEPSQAEDVQGRDGSKDAKRVELQRRALEFSASKLGRSVAMSTTPPSRSMAGETAVVGDSMTNNKEVQKSQIPDKPNDCKKTRTVSFASIHESVVQPPKRYDLATVAPHAENTEAKHRNLDVGKSRKEHKNKQFEPENLHVPNPVRTSTRNPIFENISSESDSDCSDDDDDDDDFSSCDCSCGRTSSWRSQDHAEYPNVYDFWPPNLPAYPSTPPYCQCCTQQQVLYSENAFAAYLHQYALMHARHFTQ